VVTYARCFTKGKRFGLQTEDVRALPLQGAVLKFHTWVLGERQKITAHPASPFDAAKVGAALTDGSKQKVEGIAILSASRVLVDAVGVRQLGGLASELAKQTADRAREQQDVVLAEAQELGVEGLAKLPVLQAGPAA